MPKYEDVFSVTVTPKLWNLVGVEDKALKALIEGEEEEPESLAPDLRFNEVILPLLDQLPPREADMIELYFIRRKKQSEIAYIFEITQAAVSYRLQRAAQRLRFLIEAPKLDTQEVERLLRQAGIKRRHIQILSLYRTLASQTAVSERVGTTQGVVRHVIHRSIQKLAKLAEEDRAFDDVAKLFQMLWENGNILHSVDLPQWRGRGNAKKDETFSR